MEVPIQDLLTYSRLSSADLPRQPLSLAAVLDDSQADLQASTAQVHQGSRFWVELAAMGHGA